MLKNLDFHVAQVNKSLPKMVWISSDPSHKEGDLLNCTIDYPLKKPCNFKVKYHSNMCEIILQICEQYQKIYEEERNNPNTYGIYGHSINDLFIENINIVNDAVILQMGS
jgi:hypothetical protein